MDLELRRELTSACDPLRIVLDECCAATLIEHCPSCGVSADTEHKQRPAVGWQVVPHERHHASRKLEPFGVTDDCEVASLHRCRNNAKRLPQGPGRQATEPKTCCLHRSHVRVTLLT